MYITTVDILVFCAFLYWFKTPIIDLVEQLLQERRG
jgi:hypothetical protein